MQAMIVPRSNKQAKYRYMVYARQALRRRNIAFSDDFPKPAFPAFSSRTKGFSCNMHIDEGS
jgi:hypothetical protein